MFIYQRKDWPNLKWNSEKLLPLLGEVRSIQGKIVGSMESLGFELREEANLKTLTLDVTKSTEIEGEILNIDQVKSSLAKRLGMEIPNMVFSGRDVDGVVDMMFDATQNFDKPLLKERLDDWHSSLFPTGRSGMYKIIVGQLRDDSKGPMQVVSGAIGKETIHFQAPSAKILEGELNSFLDWININTSIDPVLKAGIAHLWYITLHPYEDGNGRMTRAITDMLLARADGIKQRYYSMSAQIRIERKEYYEILEQAQKGKLDITNWLEWFLSCLKRAIESSYDILEKVIYKHNFWTKNSTAIKNDRQKLLLNKLMDGFIGKLNTSKWAKIAKCSTDTALRDIQDLLKKDILEQEPGGGRNTSYKIRKL